MKSVYILGEREKYINYAQAIEGCGGKAVFSSAPEVSKTCNALLLPGGGDIDPILYGQEVRESKNIEGKRDRTEIRLVHEFLDSGRPILGICKGLQLINVAMGGDLIQDLPTSGVHKWEESTGDKSHPITVQKESFLYPLYGERFWVNSAHHQGVGKAAPSLLVAAEADDKVIEALACPEKNVYALQFHPERMAFNHTRPDTVDGRLIFDFFMSLL